MQINAINNNHINPNFNAKLKFSGDKNLLPRKGFKQIQQKVKKIGTERDVIIVDLQEIPIIADRKYVKGIFSEKMITRTEKVGEYTNILLSHICPSFRDYDAPPAIVVEGDYKVRQEKTFEIINRYIDDIKESNKKAILISILFGDAKKNLLVNLFVFCSFIAFSFFMNQYELIYYAFVSIIVIPRLVNVITVFSQIKSSNELSMMKRPITVDFYSDHIVHIMSSTERFKGSFERHYPFSDVKAVIDSKLSLAFDFGEKGSVLIPKRALNSENSYMINNLIENLFKNTSFGKINNLGVFPSAPEFMALRYHSNNMPFSSIINKYGDLNQNQINCLNCRSSMYVVGAVVAKEMGINNIADGARKTQMFALEQEELLNGYKTFLSKYGITLLLPVFEIVTVSPLYFVNKSE